MIVIEAREGEADGRELDLFLHRAKIDIVSFDSEQTELARIAWHRYGKENHPAQLNFGDCFAYALSKMSGEPLFILRVMTLYRQIYLQFQLQVKFYDFLVGGNKILE